MSRVVVRGSSIEEIVERVSSDIQHQMESRAYRGANELRNSALLVLRGQRSGRRYKVPGKNAYYTASAPGEPPANRTGVFRLAWKPRTYFFGTSYFSIIDNNTFYADWLENGTPGGKMKPRPHHDKILAQAEPKIFKIYDEPYFSE